MAASSEEGDAIRYHIVGFGRELSKLTTSSSDLAILIDIRQQLRVGAAAALRRGDVDRTSANEIAGAIVELRLIDIMSGITEPGNGRIAFAASRAAGYCSHGVVRDALFTTSPFDAGSTVLSGAQMGELDQVAEAIHDSRVTDVMFQVEGHADSTGSEPANEAISLQRAQSVRRYLTTVKNINPASMVAVGRGSLVPLTVAVKGLEVPCNRTVQIRIQQDTSPPSR